MNSGIVRMLVVTCGMALFACGSPTEPEPALPPGAVPLEVKALDDSVDYLLARRQSVEQRREVVRDMATWLDTWTRIAHKHEPSPPMPHVDFDVEMIIVAEMGARGSSGYSIRIEGVAEQNGTLYVLVNETSPVNCMNLAVVTTPIDVVRVPYRDGPVKYRERQTERDCSRGR